MRTEYKKNRVCGSRLLAFGVVLLMFATLWTAVHATTDVSANPSQAASKLIVRLGYLEGKDADIKTKKTFTPAQLESLGVVFQNFSWFTDAASLGQQQTRGVRLRDIITAAGITAAAVEQIGFHNGAGTGMKLPAQAILQTPRYYFPNLYTKWDFGAGRAGEGAELNPVPVDTVMTLDDYYQEVTSNVDPIPDFAKATVNNRFTLCFGMADTTTNESMYSFKGVHTIDVIIRGKAPVAKPAENKDDPKKNNNKGSGSTNTGGSSTTGGSSGNSSGSTSGSGGTSTYNPPTYTPSTLRPTYPNQSGTYPTSGSVASPMPVVPGGSTWNQPAEKMLRLLTVDGGEMGTADMLTSSDPSMAGGGSSESGALYDAGEGGMAGPVTGAMGGLFCLGGALKFLAFRRGAAVAVKGGLMAVKNL